MAYSFKRKMEHVYDVQNNVDKANELITVINARVQTVCPGGLLDYSKSIQICLKDALDIVHGLELLIDRISSMELK